MIDNRNTNIFLGGVASYSGVYAGKEKNITRKKICFITIFFNYHNFLQNSLNTTLETRFSITFCGEHNGIDLK